MSLTDPGALVAVPAPVAAQSGAQRVSLEQFRQPQWLAGEWRGSGGAYASFFEEYRVVNDSTIAMRAHPSTTRGAETVDVMRRARR